MADACANCGQAMAGEFCPACGQKRVRDEDRRLGHLLRQAFAVVSDLDGRFLRSLGALAFQPGRLSRDYLDGRRMRWMSPFALFLLANVLYFVLPYGVTDFNLPLQDQAGGQPHSVITADWVPERIARRNEVWVVKKNGCIFDLIYSAPPDDFTAGRADAVARVPRFDRRRAGNGRPLEVSGLHRPVKFRAGHLRRHGSSRPRSCQSRFASSAASGSWTHCSVSWPCTGWTS